MKNSENCIMSIVFNNPEKFEDLKTYGNIFSDNLLSRIYEMLCGIGKFDKRTILDIFQTKPEYPLNKYYEILESEWDTEKFELYLNNILISHYKNDLGKLIKEIRAKDYKNYSDIKQDIEIYLRNIKNPKFYDEISSKDICLSLLEKLHNEKNSKIKSGIERLDKIQNGYDPTDYILIGAGESVGKTSYIIDLIARNIRSGKKIGLFTVEMEKEKIMHLLACNISGIDSNAIEKREMDDDKKKKYQSALEYLYDKDIEIREKNNEIYKIRSEIREMKKNGVEIIYIDYLQMLEVDGEKKLDEYKELKIISREIKNSCKENKIPHVVLACITKEGKREQEPQLYHIRGNGKIANDIDIGIIMNEVKLDINNFEERYIDFYIRKNRNGKRDKYRMMFSPSMRRFKIL